MRPFLLLACLMMFSCGGKNHGVKLGNTTKATLLQEKGVPLDQKTLPGPNGELLTYEEQESFQVKNDKVLASFKNPEGNQKLLLYWKHRFKDCPQIIDQPIASASISHTQSEHELKCPSLGLSVIYTEGSSTISRIHEYAQHEYAQQ